MPSRLDLSTAREFLDFAAGATGGVVSEAVAEQQLAGAVAVHNLLQDQSVAYLADEVGMGKTYVALGAMALLRHFEPSLRVVVIAPKENIQRKWMKEWRNFVSRIVKVEDLRVKGIGGHPARALVKVDSLVDLVTEASNDPDRDFFVRLTSFSLPVTPLGDTLSKRRTQLLKAVPWLSSELLNAQKKEYKRNFARAVNCALPDIDLLIVDEAHNLKAGWRDVASPTRNTVVGCALGGRLVDDEHVAQFKGYRRRVKRVLFLSATPIEYEIRQLWNQVDLFGFGAGWEELRDRNLTHEQHREVVRKLLIRRTAELRSGDRRLTKSEYRREWRGGGITAHDDPLAITSDQQRLAVALVQKKVSELLGSGEHNHSFQVGLLASFESFLETVKTRALREGPKPDERDDDGADEKIFHCTPEEIAATRGNRQDGVDIEAINRIARDHYREFHKEMPHPKMDAIVHELEQSFTTGRKALVFVRRVASVDELQRKLEERYDKRLFGRLRTSLTTEPLKSQLEQQISAYHSAREATRHSIRARDAATLSATDETEQSSADSFFAWFFRGEGPSGIRSGASIAEQMDRASGNYSTFLEDNYVADVLDTSSENVVAKFAGALTLSEPDALELIAREASRHIGPVKKRLQRRVEMRAFQAAGLKLLSQVEGSVGVRANLILGEVFGKIPPHPHQNRVVPKAADWLSTRTFFSELRLRPALRELLWPQSSQGDFAMQLREHELRREFLSTMVRKGHPIIDLFILIARRIGTLKQGARETLEQDLPDLAVEFLDELERQQREEPDAFNSFYELKEAAAKFHLILQLNAPELIESDLAGVPKVIGKTLRAQRPVAGMAGKVNSEVVKQFRMPGYPLILITTDLLKEGEDLHTFCSNVYHYGIAWMPSELEQRVGRIDRVGSQTERRLLALDRLDDEANLLQVYYPHLRDTVEILQIRRVYERLNRFMRIMHEGLGAPPKEKADISVIEEGLRSNVDIEAIMSPLKSAFEVVPAMLRGDQRRLAVSHVFVQEIKARFDAIENLICALGATDVRRTETHQLTGEMQLKGRVQPFTMFLRSLHGQPMLRCISPVGRIDEVDWDDDVAASLMIEPFTRIAIERNERYEAYDVAAEGDVLLGVVGSDVIRARTLFDSVISAADHVEQVLFGYDATLSQVSGGIDMEVTVAR